MNQYLMSSFDHIYSLERLKGLRKKQEYKQLVLMFTNARRSQVDLGDHNGSSITQDPDAPNQRASAPREEPDQGQPHHFISTIREALVSAEKCKSHKAEELVRLAKAILDGTPMSSGDCYQWLQGVFPDSQKRQLPSMPHSRSNRSKRESGPRWRERRRQYASMQELFKKDMSRAAKLILDGPVQATMPSVEEMVEYWMPMLTTPSKCLGHEENIREEESLQWIAEPICGQEIRANEIPLTSAPGLDSISSRQWRSVPVALRALFYNIVLAIGAFPPELLISRTIFIPKKDGSSAPSDFRPISVASVVVRQLHKIFAARLAKANLIDERQRGMHDGCAENVLVLSTALRDAKDSLKQLHVASLDVAKAFDSVSHYAITSALRGLGLPELFVRYISTTYRESRTVLQVHGQRSQPIKVTRGVRQGDPLSSLLFSVVMDRVLKSLPTEVGYTIRDQRINALAYADDIVLFASSAIGLQRLLRTAEDEARIYGLEFNSSKCLAMSIQVAGKEKKYKISTASSFKVNGEFIKQLGPTEGFRYLGIKISPMGTEKPGGKLENELANVTKAPLKPQQRLKILRCFLIPRFYHRLVLSGSRLKVLKALDRQVRIAVRKWLRLPKDTPLGYFHASCKEGGLGIPAFRTSIPGMIHARLSSMARSSCAAARDAFHHPSTTAVLRWAESALTFEGRTLFCPEDRAKYWASLLHQSNDGRELRDAGKVSASSTWVDVNSAGIPGRDYVQYHHVRINALPTRVRTSRGIRDRGVPVLCRAGCATTETAAHVIQGCHRTHGGRILRHDAICRIAASGLRQNGWTVRENPHYFLHSGLQKPDLVAAKDGTVQVIDAQVVSASTSLDDAHRRKVMKYDTPFLKHRVSQEFGVMVEDVHVTSITISWRGIWSSLSADQLSSIGLKGLLPSITTRVLQGSHTNWTRFNKMTSNIHGHRVEREGIG